MPESRWEMKIGSPVMATDGEYGPLQKVIMDPQQERIVALVVRPRGLPTRLALVVPEEAIADATDSEVRLQISLAEMHALPEYRPGTGLAVEGRVYEVDVDAFAMRGARGVRASLPAAVQLPYEPEVELPQSAGKHEALQLQAGQKVFCRDGRVGEVSAILLEPGGRVKGVVVHAGHLPGRKLIVPAAWVQGVDRGSVHLSAMKRDLANLPEYEQDPMLADEVYRAWWADKILRITDYRAMQATAEDGIVSLRGHVSSRVNRRRAEDAARLVPVVLGVKNRLVVDDDLVIGVAKALGRDPRARSANISVGAQNGIITLSGQVESVHTREAAEEVAASIPEVRGVVNCLRAPNVVVDAQEGQILEPPIGGEAIATDGSVGQVERVILDPHNRRVTGFVLHGYFPEPQHANDRGLPDEKPRANRRVTVPISMVRYETDNSVDLDVSSVEIARTCEFDAADFVAPPECWQPPYPYARGDVLFKRESEDVPEICDRSTQVAFHGDGKRADDVVSRTVASLRRGV